MSNDATKVLILIPIKNCQDTLPRALEQIVQLNYPKNSIDIAMLENDSDDQTFSVAAGHLPVLQNAGFRRIYLAKQDYGFKLDHKQRHEQIVQAARLRVLTRVRQEMVDRFLSDQDFVWNIDADIVTIPKDAINVLLGFNADVVMPRVILENSKAEYDGTTRIIYQNRYYIPPELPAEAFDERLLEAKQHCGTSFFKSEVLKTVRYTDGDRHNLQQEVAHLTILARRLGYKLYWTPQVVLEHSE